MTRFRKDLQLCMREQPDQPRGFNEAGRFIAVSNGQQDGTPESCQSLRRNWIRGNLFKEPATLAQEDIPAVRTIAGLMLLPKGFNVTGKPTLTNPRFGSSHSVKHERIDSVAMLCRVGDCQVSSETIAAEAGPIDLETFTEKMKIFDQLGDVQNASGVIRLPVSTEVNGNRMVAAGEFGKEPSPVAFNGAEQVREENQCLPCAVLFIIHRSVSGENQRH